MKRILMMLVTAGLMLAEARAQGGLAIGGKLGTLGPGLEMTGYLLPQLNVRVNGNYLPFSVHGSSDDVDYDVDIRFASVIGMFDWFPFENNFRVTAGVAFNNNKLDLKGDLGDSTTLGDHSYSASEIGTLKGRATFDDVAPYLGIGYGNAVADDVDLTFSFDLGVIFQGTPDIQLSANGTKSGDPTFQADLKKEEQDAQDVADKFKVYPVISFGIAYYFW